MQILPIYYLTYLIITLIGQFTVLLLILFRTPPFFNDFRLFLVNSSILQIFISILTYFTQIRPVINKSSTAYLFSGYCKYFERSVCLFSFDLFQIIFNASSFSIPCTLWYKNMKLSNLNRQARPSGTVRLIFLSTYSISIIVAILYILSYDSAEMLKIECDTKAEHGDMYNYSKYAGITGTNNSSWGFIINLLNTLSVYIPPGLSLFFMRHMQRKLKLMKHLFTEKTALQARRFDLALTIQTFLPALCVLPAYSAFIFAAIFDYSEIAHQGKLIYILLSVPTAIDAIIVITTITPYRRAFLNFFSLKPLNMSTVTQVRSRNSNWF